MQCASCQGGACRAWGEPAQQDVDATLDESEGPKPRLLALLDAARAFLELH